MNWYRMLYEGKSGVEDQPDAPRPTGLRLLVHVFCRQWWNLIGLNILFWACCLPLITIPAALKAMTRVCVGMLEEDRADFLRIFWKSFREDFLRTTAAGLIMAALICVCTWGLWFYAGAMAENGIMAAVVVLLLLLWVTLVMSLFSLFPMLAFAELSIGQMLKNAVLMTLIRPGKHLAVMAGAIVLIVLYIICYPYSTVALGAILLSAFWLCACFVIWPVIKQYIFQK